VTGVGRSMWLEILNNLCGIIVFIWGAAFIFVFSFAVDEWYERLWCVFSGMVMMYSSLFLFSYL